MKKLTRIALSVAAVTLACSAFAQKQGDNILGVGVAFVNPSTSVGTFSSTYSVFTDGLAGATGSISKESTLSLSWLHMYTDNLGVEATIGIPPKHTLDLQTPNGQVASHPAAATVKTWTPAVVGKYFFGNAGEVWRPYLGLGTSNVSFHGPAANPSDATVQAMAGTSVKMSSSWAPVYNAGMIYNIDNRWSVNASVSYLPIKTHVTFLGSAQTTQGDVKINTTDYVIRVGYKF